MELIDKAAVVAEIERRIKVLQDLSKENEKKLDSFQKTAIYLCIDECKVILSFLDTLEVKEVNLEKEIKEQIDKYYENCNKKLEEMGEDDNDISFLTLDGFARHFYELGLKAQKDK